MDTNTGLFDETVSWGCAIHSRNLTDGKWDFGTGAKNPSVLPMITFPSLESGFLEIHYTETAIADLERLPPRIAEQTMRKIDRLQNGLHGDIKRLTQFDHDYRLRSGDYRILFDVEDSRAIIQRILHRKEAYD
jgi:mRNA interferase RelE/StbE